ncbi:MAG: PaaI family thioesterase [Acidimicrobiia bacterium]|jgi:acyl-coenzyme A thioesterase PaaI-like protein
MERYNLDPPRPARDFPFVERLGLELLHVERGRTVMRLPFELNINHVGMIYAGALFTVAEVPGGVLFGSAFDISRFYPIVGDMSIRFVKPAMTDVTVDARMTDEEIERVTAELEERGKAKYVLDQEIRDTGGVLVATTSATYFGRSF